MPSKSESENCGSQIVVEFGLGALSASGTIHGFEGKKEVVDDTQLTKLSHKLGIAAAELEIARHFVEEYGGFSEPYENTEGYDDLSFIAKAFLEAKIKLDFVMDTLPKKQQAI